MRIDVTQPVKVTVSDPETGVVLEEHTISNDYVLVTAGRRYLKSMQMMGQTHMLAVAYDNEPHPATFETTATP